MAVTVTNIGNTLIANGGPTAGGDVKFECHSVETTAGTDLTASITTSFSHILGISILLADATDATVDDTDYWQLDQDIDSTKKCVVVASGAISIRRVGNVTAGTLVGGNYLVTLIGF